MPSTASSIHVALAADDNYFKGLIVTAWSIASNCAPARHICLHVLDGGISEGNWRDLVAVLRPFNCSLVRHRIDPNAEFDGLGEWHGASKMAYARLLLPALLPDVKEIIYSDVDFVWLGDVSRLWGLADERLILQYVPERTPGREVGAIERNWIESRGYTLTPGKYFSRHAGGRSPRSRRLAPPSTRPSSAGCGSARDCARRRPCGSRCRPRGSR